MSIGFTSPNGNLELYSFTLQRLQTDQSQCTRLSERGQQDYPSLIIFIYQVS